MWKLVSFVQTKKWNRKWFVNILPALVLLAVIYICQRINIAVYNRWILLFVVYPVGLWLMVMIPQIRIKSISFWGAASFEIYLWHSVVYYCYELIFKIFDISITHNAITMILFCASSVLIGAIVYRYVEMPIQKRLTIWRTS